MKADDKNKLDVISSIDKLQPKLRSTIYERELKSMREKYVFKDISYQEFLKDVYYLKQIKKIIIQ